MPRTNPVKGPSALFNPLLLQLRNVLLIFGACLIFFSGCAREESDFVTLWHQMRPDDHAVLRQRIKEFERRNPEIQVRELYKENETLRSGLESAVLVGHGPHIVYGPSDVLGVYHEMGALQDITPWFDESEQAKFDHRALIKLPSPTDPETNELLFVGDRFGNHLALIYNRDLVPNAPTTTAELLDSAVRATVDESKDGRPEQYGLVWNYTEPFFVIPFLTGYGAWVFEETDDGSPEVVPSLDSPESIAAYQFVSDLRSKYKVLPQSSDYEAADALFLAGKAGMILNGDWSWQKYVNAPGIDAVVVPLPIVEETGLAMGPMVAPKGYSLSVVTQGVAADRAMKLVQFLTSEETQRIFLTQQKILPSRLSLREDPLVQSDPILRTSVIQAENGRSMPTVTEMRAVWDAMRPPYQKLMSGKLDAAAAAHEMQSDALAKINILTQSVEPDRTAIGVQWLGTIFLLGLLWYQRHNFTAFFRDFNQQSMAYLFAMPAVALILLTVVFPLAYNVMLSFSNMSLTNFRDWEIIGIRNYSDLFTGAKSGEFWNVFGKTILWTVINVVCHVVIGVFLAVILNGPVRGKSIYRIFLIIPWAVPAYITALTWRGMFDSEFGAVNHAVVAINRWLPELLQLPIMDWLGTEWPAFAACTIANVWLGFPFMMVIALGGLQGIPGDLYEAARIDRASRWQQFRYVTLPLLKPVLMPAVTLGAIWTFNNLNVVWLVSNRGEPGDKTHILVSYVYRAVFNLYQYGYGAALSMVIFLMLLVFSVVFLNRGKATESVY